MKKIQKGFLFYLLVLLGILITAFLICVFILIFNPGTDIFGVKYFNVQTSKLYDEMEVYSYNAENETYNLDNEALIKSRQIDNIIINSNSYSVKVLVANATHGPNYTEFHVTINSDKNGFTTENVFDPIVEIKYLTNTRTLYIFATIPDGFWNTGNNSSITVQIPETYNTSNTNLKILSTYGNVILGDEANRDNLAPSILTLKTIDITTKGNLTVTKYTKIGQENLINNTNLKSKINIEGNINFQSTLSANEVIINAKNSNATFQGITAKNIKMNCNTVFGSFGNIKGELRIESIYGSQNFGDIEGSVTILKDSKNCNYEFNSISKGIVAGWKKIDNFPEIKIENCNITIKEKMSGYKDIHSTGEIKVI